MNQIQIVFTKNAHKDIKKLNKVIIKRLLAKIDYYSNHQPLKLATKLTSLKDSQYRWRIGNYRVLFDYNQHLKIIIILKIQHRREVYRITK